MSKEIEDEFYCGTNEEINEFGSPIDITKKLLKRRTDIFYTHTDAMIAKAQEKLDRISDLDFVRLWQSEINIFDFLEELQDRIGCLFSGTEMLRCIEIRANQLRRQGVRIQTFTI